jgi:hypothetical protein
MAMRWMEKLGLVFNAVKDSLNFANASLIAPVLKQRMQELWMINPSTQSVCLDGHGNELACCPIGTADFVKRFVDKRAEKLDALATRLEMLAESNNS